MSEAAVESDPLLGIAMRSSGSVAESVDSSIEPGETMVPSEVWVDGVERESGGEHQHLRVVEQLADLHGRPLMALPLRGHPGLGSLLDQLLADRLHSRLERLHSSGRARA